MEPLRMIVGASHFRSIAQPFVLPSPPNHHRGNHRGVSLPSPTRLRFTRAHTRFNIYPSVVCKDEGETFKNGSASNTRTTTRKRSKTSKGDPAVDGVSSKEPLPMEMGGAQPLLRPVSVQIPLGDRHIHVETGRIGRQASGSVTVTDGETIIYTSVCTADDPSEPSDFFPLTVNYQERFSAAGRTSGGFIKREGRLKDHEILICRLIDRPLRPTILKGFYHETQILSWVLSYDGLHCPDSLAITAAGTALALSEVPISKAVAGVRVGLIGDQFVVNPTVKQMELSKLDLLLAGTADAIIMIEGYSDFLTEEVLLQAVDIAQGAVKAICKEVETLASKCGKVKNYEAIRLPPPELYERVEELAGRDLIEALQIKSKMPRIKAISSLEQKILSVLVEDEYIRIQNIAITPDEMVHMDEDEEDEEMVLDGEVDEGDVHIKPVSRKPIMQFFDPADVKLVFKEVTSKFLRRRIVKDGRRSDGRHAAEIRQIQSQCGLLPRAHGSALFTRGETQSLAVTTLGGNRMGQRVNNLVEPDDVKRFYLQYSFPPSCVGEVGRMGAPNRREIGHGMLAERALEPALPAEEEFPYTIRVESTITESNGSSSMASVCGGCLSLLDAGVPLKCSIAGVAMGMVFDTKECGGDGTPLILSDIIGSEDALGDMDFKVAGNETGITAFQLDLKIEGITMPILKQALLQAKNGRCHILAEMTKCFPLPSRELSKYAPLIDVLKVKPERVNIIVGTGGKTVKSIIEETGVDSIDMQDDGLVKIVAKDSESMEKAKCKISGMIMVPQVGDIYRNCEVKSLAPYGVFVEIAPGREGLCHISELSTKWLARAEDMVKVGDRLDVKLIEINERGQLRLSHRALLQAENQEKSSSEELTSTGKDASTHINGEAK